MGSTDGLVEGVIVVWLQKGKRRHLKSLSDNSGKENVEPCTDNITRENENDSHWNYVFFNIHFIIVYKYKIYESMYTFNI